MTFARTPEFEDLFARGYPHLRRLVDGHPDDQTAEATAECMLDAIDAAHYHVDWPREVAHRYVRGLANVGSSGIGLSARRKDLPEADAGLRKAGPVDNAEGRTLIAALLAPDHSHYGFQVEHGARSR